MKRLVKKSEKGVYIPVNELDEADIKFNRCPLCKTPKPLKREDGFKTCLNCGTKFKTFDGDAFLVSE